ncbi:cation channel sperm associated auxiliary subunit gamma, transcript variant X1 [Ictidomys tridecemlineatus]|uniref:Cation channel sperm associated auxiliary subunit gamma n=2 Tax=Ictidomys tridecemlineatus TaxID=43179 RepID=I3MMY9_ICTTR|nr:cation channel sperm-associated protein subunit gamma isoform X1 [Ictidomys tridecemlineatus]KAG3255972.1 cation channel sperm associated auxiliary subunit gamma, transcript variant X1 [Ictidomys tridecemlineatus]
MSPASPVWLRVQVLRVLWALLAVLLGPWRLWAVIYDFHECTWHVVLNKFQRVGENLESDQFVHQEPVDTVRGVFNMLVDSPIDRRERYLGFPYYLKINYSCHGQHSEDLVRSGHLMGLKPLVLVTFQAPVNFYRWKIEQLQIQMEAAPFRSKEPCMATEVCVMSWYTPMPIKNGSVVMRVDVSSNGLGPIIPSKRFHVNINGFLKMGADNRIQFTVGDELFDIKPRYFVNVSSRPLWYNVDQSPVLILGGIPNEKALLMTSTNFREFSLVELSIDSCWVGSFYCPQADFSATIYDAISTESTLFIRQNQLIYYYTGTYATLYDSSHSSGKWVRVLASECIKRLCPVYFSSNGSDHVIALTTGKHEGYLHLGTITDGLVSFELLPRNQTTCKRMLVDRCSIIWAIFIPGQHILMMLVETQYDDSDPKYYQLASYDLITEEMTIHYTLPLFIPDARGLEFLMILGTESYTNTPMIPKGLSFNLYNNLLFIWGNFLLQSYNAENFIYLADFPKESSIKYMVNSFRGDVAIVTETEEIWYLLEGTYHLHRIFPSHGWDIHVSLQVMKQSSLYASKETMVTLFYEDKKLYQLVYLTHGKQDHLVKRLVPMEKLLMYEQHKQIHRMQDGSRPTLSFSNLCPFEVMRLGNLPNPQAYTRQERYLARPPMVLNPSGFHSENSLAVYQGLVYYLLRLHSKYDKPYADPVHDPTWSWWKNKKQDEDYYFYLASNWLSTGGVHIDMGSYEKIYDLKSHYGLPERIFLDKGGEYHFSIFLTARGHSFEMGTDVGSAFKVQSKVSVGVVLADPSCTESLVKQKVLVKRNSVLFLVTLRDKSLCYDQGISGHHLMKTSMMVKVVGASGFCFQDTHLGPRLQGNLMVPVFIGCPPGKRLAFDITYTLKYMRQQNKHYFDCMQEDPEMPCFLYRDMFYPFFLIQDLVTGDSGSFKGSYVLKVVGGGPSLDSMVDYNEEEIYRYNSPLDKTGSRIWTTKTSETTHDMAFYIMSYERSGIEWLCLENSPCYDMTPQGIIAPDFFFKVLVSNRGVDNSTYCNYQLIFLLHIHGLPLSAKRALFIVIVSASVLVGMVILYILFCLLWPYAVNACNHLRWRINNIIASESYYTYATSSRAFSVSSQSNFGPFSQVPSVDDFKVQDQKHKADLEPAEKKKP